MLETLAQPATGIVSPRVHNADGTLHHSLRREPSLRRTLGLTGTGLPAFAEYVNRSEEYSHAQVVDWAMGAILLVARDCYDAVGGWDESYFLYSEETDFCLRARDLGFLTRYEPRAVAVHIGAGSGQSARTHSMQIINRVRLYRRRHGRVAALAYLLLTALREAVWIRRGGERHRVAISALFLPSRRPAELGCSDHLIPR
jgi:GT2 family glycosyltransferase